VRWRSTKNVIFLIQRKEPLHEQYCETHDAKQEDETLGTRAGDPARPV
jgi:hypothetical protein